LFLVKIAFWKLAFIPLSDTNYENSSFESSMAAGIAMMNPTETVVDLMVEGQPTSELLCL
jgi:hypothetical protein